MFEFRKIKPFVITNWQWIILIFIYSLLIQSFSLTYHIINNILYNCGMVIVFTIVSWGYLTLTYYIYHSSISKPDNNESYSMDFNPINEQ